MNRQPDHILDRAQRYCEFEAYAETTHGPVNWENWWNFKDAAKILWALRKLLAEEEQ